MILGGRNAFHETNLEPTLLDFLSATAPRRSAADGVGNSDGDGFGQGAMHKQFADQPIWRFISYMRQG